MLTVSEKRAFSIERDAVCLVSSGMVKEEEDLDDFLAVWRALEGKGTNVRDHQHQWRVIDRGAYRFPGRRPVGARDRLHASPAGDRKAAHADREEALQPFGNFILGEVLGAAFGDVPPDEGDATFVLKGYGCSRVGEKYWVGPANGYSVLHTVVRKMLAFCGPLDLATLRQGMVRHQKRHGVAVPSLEMIDAFLRRREDIVLDEDGKFGLTAGARDTAVARWPGADLVEARREPRAGRDLRTDSKGLRRSRPVSRKRGRPGRELGARGPVRAQPLLPPGTGVGGLGGFGGRRVCQLPRRGTGRSSKGSIYLVAFERGSSWVWIVLTL